MKAVFVTGTDTEVGKTVVCGLLGRYLLDKGYKVITQKWIQTGLADYPSDIATHLKIMKKTTDDIKADLAYVEPYNFDFPASPHLAANLEKKEIDAEKIKTSFKTLAEKFDFVIAEGIGGALVPFNEKNLVIDIAKELNLPVIIVAKNKLGAINHTLLTIEALKTRGMKILGIIFNSKCEKEDEIILKDNIRIIEKISGQKTLGNLPWLDYMDLLYEAFKSTGEKFFNQMME